MAIKLPGLLFNNFGIDGLGGGFGGLGDHNATRHIYEGKDNQENAESLHHKVWDDDFAKYAERATDDANQSENNRILVVWIVFFTIESVLETENTLDE